MLHIQKLAPQLACVSRKPPRGNQWIHEPKLDGYRLIAIKNHDKVTLLTRKQNDWTDRFKSIATTISKLPYEHLVFDGEVVILNDQGFPDFQMLQNSLDGLISLIILWTLNDQSCMIGTTFVNPRQYNGSKIP